MLKRIITSVVALLIFIPILIFSDTWVFPIAMSACAAVGCLEMISCAKQKKNLWLIIPMLLCAVALPVLTRVASSASRSFHELLTFAVGVFLVLSSAINGLKGKESDEF